MFGKKKKKDRVIWRSLCSGKKEKRSVIRRFFRLVKWGLIIGLVGWVALTYHMRGLDRIIEEKFDKPRKWDLPSRIYSDAEYLYPGIDIKVREIISKLDRLGYRNTGDAIKGPGDYAISDGKLDVYLHNFEYPEEPFIGFPVHMIINGSKVENIVRLDTKEELELTKLEPEEIASVFNDAMENRTVIKISDVPKHLIETIILIEDERFLKHKGVDPVGILRAAAVNIASMRVKQGGSTLTQQLVKNFFLYPKRTFSRKINEMMIAYRIEKTHSKAEILEAYLNEIYLGQRGSSSVSGVEEASRLYFAKNASQLTLGECAMLAGMIRSPSEYNPIIKPDKAKARRDFVLKRMFDEGFATKEEYASAVAEKIITPKPKTRISTAPFFIDFVKRQIQDLYPQEVLQTEGLRVFTTLDMTMQLAAERVVNDGLDQLEKNSSKILPEDHAGLLEACLIAMQPSTGFVRALVGGKNYAQSQFDRCTQAMRQPGSTFKPFVYLTAVDPRRSKDLFTPASIMEDRAFEVESGGKKWSPQNYDKKEHGPVTLAMALEHSYNITAAKIAMAAGLENVVQTARDAGITSPLDPVPSLALGSFEVTPIEMASAYSIFPNGGIRAEPISIINVVTKEGQILEKKSLIMKRQFDAAPVFITTTMLKGVMERGTGASAKSFGVTATTAGKTGTTSNYRDAWFVGFTPKLMALVWLGYDDNTEIHMSGGKAALPLWARFIKEIVPTDEGDFASPSGVSLVKMDLRSGGLSTSACPNSATEAFIEGMEPERPCNPSSPQTIENFQDSDPAIVKIDSKKQTKIKEDQIKNPQKPPPKGF